MLTRFTNCRLACEGRLVDKDLVIDSCTGKIVDYQAHFYDNRTLPENVVDLQGRILAPGFIDVQLNGAVGFDFSVIPDEMDDYLKGVLEVNQALVKTGVTSYLPTITSQSPVVYQTALPHLAPRKRSPSTGAECLGAHCEGPFLQPEKNGIHDKALLLSPTKGFDSFLECYGADNFPYIRMITAAPELPEMEACIRQICEKGIIFSIGHSKASLEEAEGAVMSGASCVTHMFNAMLQPHHRDPGIFGLLGSEDYKRPYFGLICDGMHVHPNCIKMAYNAHRSGTILVTDAMSTLGLPDGVYPWTNGEDIEKRDGKMVLVGTETIAGSCITLDQCLRNFMRWTGVGIAEAIQCVTEHPAKLLKCYGEKGSLQAAADADLVVLDDEGHVKMVFKSGTMILDEFSEYEMISHTSS